MRKAPSNSTSEALRIMKAANRVILPPDHIYLTDEELIYFDNVVAEFARADWSAHQLELAAFLARAMCATNAEQLLVTDEGSVMMTTRGTPVINPRRTVLQMNATAILSYRRSLQLNTVRSGPGANSRQAGKQIGMGKQIEGDAPDHLDDDDESDDDLLAAPGQTPRSLPAPVKKAKTKTSKAKQSADGAKPPWTK